MGYKKDMGSKHGIQLKVYSSTKGFGGKGKWKEKESLLFLMEKSMWER